MEDNELNYAEELRIDPNLLDVECLRQPELFMEWAERATEAHADIERAKLRMDVKKATIDKEVREDPGKFGLSKVTEAAVQSAVLSSEEYREKNLDYIKAMSNAKLLDYAVRAFDQRKSMLNNLITLHGQQYFAGPKVPHDLPAEFLKHREKISKDTTAAQKGKARKRK